MLKNIKKKNEITNENILELVNSIDTGASDFTPSDILPINTFTLVEELLISRIYIL